MRRALALLLPTLLACAREHPAAPETVPARLDIFPVTSNPSHIGISLGGRLRVPVSLISAAGSEMELPPGVTLVSRNPAAVSVDSGTWITARGLGPEARIVASIVIGGQTFSDSIGVSVVCTAELVVIAKPNPVNIAVGDTVTVSASRSTCGGQIVNPETATWTSNAPAIATVDAVTGLVRGVAPGTTYLMGVGRTVNFIGPVPVTVR
jgi:hypothetical protein